MATCGCVGGGWVRMVAVGKVGKVRRRGGDCNFLRWVMYWGSEVRRLEVFSKLFLTSVLTAENTQDHSVQTEDKNLHVCRLFIFRLRLNFNIGWHVSHLVFSAAVLRMGPIVSKT